MTTQPVWTSATLVAVVTAVVALLVAFGIQLNETQTAAIIGLAGVVAPFVVALLSNSKVTPLVKPEDEDGTPLVRADNMPTHAQVRSMRK